MKPPIRIAATVMALAGLAALPACKQEAPENWVVVGPTPAVGQSDVSLYRDVLFADIPIPEGYQLDRLASYSFQGSMFRQGVFHMNGNIHWLDALDFFRAHLPAAGWTQDKVERGFDFRVLHFRKGPEKLIVVVRQTGTGSSTEMQLDNVAQNDLLLRGKLPGDR